jgi:hypothetical protein
MPSKVIFYEDKMFKLLESPRGAVGKDLARRGRLVRAAAKKQVGVRTGALRSSIHMRHLADSMGQYVQIGSDLNYALMHHNGTKPYLILPNRSPVLAFEKRGKLILAHSVNHPGTKANKYLTDNLGLIA